MLGWSRGGARYLEAWSHGGAALGTCIVVFLNQERKVENLGFLMKGLKHVFFLI